jgi:hypothetical protein
MDKVVPCLIPYNSVFYLKFFDQDKANFLLNQIMFSLEIRFKSKSALFFRARPSSFLPPWSAHAQPTHATPFPCPRVRWTTTARPCRRRPRQDPTSSSSAWRNRTRAFPPPFLYVAPPTPTPPPFPFLRSKATDALRLSLLFRGRVRQRSSSAPLPPLSAEPVHRSRAPKRHRPHRICAEAPPLFPSSVSSASALSLPNWLSPNNCIPSP